MPGDHRGVARIVASWCAVLALTGPGAAVLGTGADAASMLVGLWYGERAYSDLFAGRAFDQRRWVMVHRSDGTARDIYRYYLKDVLQGEFIEEYTWGVDRSIYWTVCRSESVNGVVGPCSARTEYEIQSTTPQEFRYRSVKTGTGYSVVCVPPEFRLP